MAKTKKQVLSLDERLEQALVPESEQPYAVPENWTWSYLSCVCDFVSGFAFKSASYKKEGTPLVRISNIVDNQIDLRDVVYIQDDSVESRFHIHKGDLLIALSGATTGKNGVYQHENLAYLNQRIGNMKILSSKLLSQHYRNWFIANENDKILRLAYGGAQPNISPKVVGKIKFPLPPLKEQHRIALQIESLFQKLDSARNILQNALDSFEIRKAAILHKAFTGQLTKKWRNKKHLDIESWEKVLLKDVCEPISCGGTPTGRIVATGCIPFLKVYNIVNNKIDFSYKPQFIDEEIHSTRLKKSILKPYDVIMNIVGPPLRKIAVVPNDYPEWNMNQAIVRFRPLKKLDYRYLYYCLCYPATLDDVIKDTKGVVGQANISITQSRNLSIPLPSLYEQHEIVRILDSLLENEQKAKDLCNILDQIDLMKKAILARAFRGELGTNDPNEESALELLKDILAKAETK